MRAANTVPEDASEQSLCRRWSAGEREALDRLVELMWADLKRLAARLMAAERAAHTLQPTALVHEAWLRLAKGPGMPCRDQSHFRALASIAMKRVLVEHGRRRRRQKRGGEWARLDKTMVEANFAGVAGIGLGNLADALASLEFDDPHQSGMVALRYFGGLSEKEMAQYLGMPISKVKRDLTAARGWLGVALGARPRA